MAVENFSYDNRIVKNFAYATIFWGIIGMLVGVSLIVNLFMACAVGALIPMMLRRFKIDPALASSVFLITLTDCIGFFVFLGLATLFLEGLRG